MQPAPIDKTLGLDRGAVVVCMPVTAVDAHTLASLRSVLEYTDASVPLLLTGPVAACEQIAAAIGDDGGERTIFGFMSHAEGVVTALNAAIAVGFPSDVALVVPGIRVTSGWLERLRIAVGSDSTVASATPLSLGVGAIELSAGDPSNRANVDESADRVRRCALKLYPRIVTVGPGCAYIRRAALELAGLLDESLALDDALADLAVRVTALGMVHVVADDVLVAGRDGSCASEGEQPQLKGERLSLGGEQPSLVEKQPSSDGRRTSSERESSQANTHDSARKTDERVRKTIVCDDYGSLRRALTIVRTALRGLSVTVDARALAGTVGGTQTYIVGLVLALARGGEVAVRVLTPPDLSHRAAAAFASAPGVELLSYEQALRSPPRSDVVHRPQQVFTPEDLALLRLVGERIVIGQQDLIAYHNYSYHPDIDAWRAYRRTTRLALSAVDQVIFFSEHARHDALVEDLLPAERTHVVGIGSEPLEPAAQEEGAPEPEDGASEGLRGDDLFMLCIGADFAHKNRPFAIELLGALRELGWMGRLVLAGPHVPHGSSREHERELLRARPALAEFVLDLGPVDERRRDWLYSHARALVYPTLYEGFGLLPLEAAHAGLPCLFAPQASLSELAGEATTLLPWDAAASAAAVLPLLADGPARGAHLAQLQTQPPPGWDDVARRVVGVYEHALAAPPSEAAPHAWQELDRESYIVRLAADVDHHTRVAQEHQDAYHALAARVSAGLPLIDEGGLLTPAQQRGLMRIAGRGRLGAAALKPFGLLGRGGRGMGGRGEGGGAGGNDAAGRPRD
jgi:glycosyltransferase involved in cell wall biosynthesis